MITLKLPVDESNVDSYRREVARRRRPGTHPRSEVHPRHGSLGPVDHTRRPPSGTHLEVVDGHSLFYPGRTSPPPLDTGPETWGSGRVMGTLRRGPGGRGVGVGVPNLDSDAGV